MLSRTRFSDYYSSPFKRPFSWWIWFSWSLIFLLHLLQKWTFGYKWYHFFMHFLSLSSVRTTKPVVWHHAFFIPSGLPREKALVPLYIDSPTLLTRILSIFFFLFNPSLDWNSLILSVHDTDRAVWRFIRCSLVVQLYQELQYRFPVITLPPGSGAKYCDHRVCLSVCFFVWTLAYLKNYTRPNFTKFAVAMAWSSNGSAIHNVHPVLWMT